MWRPAPAGSAAATWTSAPELRRVTSNASSSSSRRPTRTARTRGRTSAPTSSTTRGPARKRKVARIRTFSTRRSRTFAPPGSPASFAAGNYGPELRLAVGRARRSTTTAFTVGATYLTDVIANFSARGPVRARRLAPDEARHLRAGRERADELQPQRGRALRDLHRHLGGVAARRRGRRAPLVRGPVARRRRGPRPSRSSSDGAALCIDDRLRRLLRRRRAQPGLRLGTARRRGGRSRSCRSAACRRRLRAARPGARILPPRP